jgi:hypothetical protein
MGRVARSRLSGTCPGSGRPPQRKNLTSQDSRLQVRVLSAAAELSRSLELGAAPAAPRARRQRRAQPRKARPAHAGPHTAQEPCRSDRSHVPQTGHSAQPCFSLPIVQLAPRQWRPAVTATLTISSPSRNERA